MTAIETELDMLKKDLDGILQRYNVPMDDRTLVSDKIDESVAAMLNAQRDEFNAKAESISDMMADQRNGFVRGLEEMENAVRSNMNLTAMKAYQEGLAQGAAGSKPGLLQIVVAVALLGLVAFFVIKGLFF